MHAAETISQEITISPGGRLSLQGRDGPEVLSATQARGLAQAFEESSSAGLVALVSTSLAGALPPGLFYWRDFARSFFHCLCHQGEGSLLQWQQLPPPPAAELERLLSDAPPMRGLEFLTVDLLQLLWSQLRDFAVQRAGQCEGGTEEYLRSVNPVWHQLGRVTFHLAENKRDPSHPFAFMATYTHRVSQDAKLQHLPLGSAIQHYAGKEDRAVLTSLLEPVRRAAEHSDLVREMLDSKAIFQPQAWNIAQAHRLLLAAEELERCGIVVRVPDWWKKGRMRRAVVEVQVGNHASGQLGAESVLDFSPQLVLDGETLTPDECRALLASTEGMVLLRGHWVEVDRDRLRQTLEHWERLADERPDGLTFLEGMRLLAGAEILPSPVSDRHAGNEWSMLTAGPWLKHTLAQIRDPHGVDGCQPGRDLQTQLRPYQEDGVRWLWFMTRLGLGACLADDMGLGKTIQVIDLLLLLKRETAGQRKQQRKHAQKPSLLIVPASLIGNWKREIERFGPALQVFYAHRSECSTDALAEVDRDPTGRLAGFDLVVTTYGLARRLEWPAAVDWRLVVLDEAQAIKNAGSSQSKAVRQLRSQGRVALSGTPVENHLGDLWSLFDFCCPGLLGTAGQFKSYLKKLEKQQVQGAYGPLRRLVRPYILRRLKTDPAVAPDLPEKTEMSTDCALSKKQAVLYGRAVQDFRQRLNSSEGMARRGLVLSTLMQLKQICNHPAQYLGESEYPPRDSGKLTRLEQLCEPIVERQEKMLVFTQFRTLVPPLADFLAVVFGQPGVMLHGGTPVRRRKTLVADFQRDEGPPFFVISLKAGGSGLNLTQASHVVHFDRWWNPAVENQATDRAFRIGQQKNVLVHKFVCRGTVEEKIARMIAEKQQLSDELLDEGAETALTEMDDQQLIELVTLDLQRASASE